MFFFLRLENGTVVLVSRSKPRIVNRLLFAKGESTDETFCLQLGRRLPDRTDLRVGGRVMCLRYES